MDNDEGILQIGKLSSNVVRPLWPSGIGALGTEQVVSLIPGSVGYISYPMFIEPRITWVSLGFFGYIGLDTKIVLKESSHRKRIIE